jgi:alcohol dehydrogenase
MLPFDFQPRTRLVFGAGSLKRLGELAVELGARRVLVVSDPGIVAAGHPARAVEYLAKAGLEAEVFDGVRENPDSSFCLNAPTL